MTKVLLSFLTFITLSVSNLPAQAVDLSIKLLDSENQEPLIGATILINEIKQGTVTDIDGIGLFSNLLVGSYRFEFSFVGYEKKDTIISVNGSNSFFTFSLQSASQEISAVTIKATRSTRTITNIPTRIEFIGGEELEEKAIMNAPNISMVLRESTGIQIQQTSLSSGNRSIRIQGLDGRYTQLLKDGFPLYGGFSGGLSIMQIPPLDLAQFEIIKGSSSTLYGGGAIAGLVNMVSKRPTEETDLNILISQTHTGGSSGNVFYSKRKEKLGFALYGAAHYNSTYNPDDDTFTNIPETTSFSLNPKLFYYPNEKSTVWIGINATTDKREGGDINVVKNGVDANHTYFENNSTNRFSTQFAYEYKLAKSQTIEFKNSVGFFSRKINQPNYIFNGDETNTFTEFNYGKNGEKSDWIVGANLYTNTFKETGGGLGYKIPDIFTEDAATLNFRNVKPISPDNLNAERSYGANLDINYKSSLTDHIFFSINQLFYLTEISNALLLENISPTEYLFSNAPENIRSLGSETNVKFTYKDLRWFINYALIDTRLKYLEGNPLKPLTPKHNAGSVLMYENKDWRIGYEVYYTGKQYLSNGTQTKDFTTVGLLIQKHFKWGSPYINFENFTDRRQSRYSPEVLGTVRNPVFPEIYAPTDGFIFTVGINIKPFGREECTDDCHSK
ncbi:MAG: TonB-dependent receptor [Saprospiraceae bacterium]|nr:TonB-dependent receptor [Saprospiraceae bacterium]